MIHLIKSKVFTPYLVYSFLQCCDDALWCNVEEMEQQLQAEPGLLGLEPVNLAKHLNGGIYSIGIVPLCKSPYSCIASLQNTKFMYCMINSDSLC